MKFYQFVCFSLIASVTTFSSISIVGMPKTLAQRVRPTQSLDQRSVDNLIEQLRLATYNSRYEIIETLKKRGPTAIPALIKALESSDPYVCSGAAEVLGSFGEDAIAAVPTLIKLLQDPRRAIFSASGNSPLVLPLPTPSLRIPYPGESKSRSIPNPPENPQNLIRIYALAAIGQIGGGARTTATSAIAPLLKDADPWVRLNAAWSLIQMGAETPVLSTYLDVLQDPDPAVRLGTARALPSWDALIQKMIGAEATPETANRLVESLGDANRNVRDRAIDWLTLLDRNALPALSQALKHPKPLVRLETAKILGKMGSSATSALPMLATLLQDRERYTPPAPPPSNFAFPEILLPALPAPYGSKWNPVENPEQWVRSEAIAAIALIGTDDPAILKSVQRLAQQDPSPWVRLQAIWAVSQLGGDVSSLIQPVAQLLKSSDRSLQQVSLTVLEQMGATASPVLLEHYMSQLSSPATRTDAVFALGNRDLGAPVLMAVPKLRSFLTGEDKTLRGYTATILATISEKIVRDANQNRLTSQQLKSAIAEFSQALTVMQAPQAKFNRPPVQRLQQSVARLKQLQR
jgi:HEAT repeat protein